MISATLCYSQDSHAFPPRIHVFESAGQTSPMRLRTLKSGLPNGSKLSTSVQKKCQRLPIRSLSEKCTVSTHHWIFSLMDGGNLNYVIYCASTLLPIMFSLLVEGKRFKSTICASWFLEANLVNTSICNPVGDPNFWTSESCHLSN